MLRDSPWNFDKNLVLLKDFDGIQQVSNIHFTEVTFWIRIHDLPLMAHNEYVGRLIGNSIGVTEEVDLDAGEFEWGEYMGVRVKMDITKPVPRKKKL